MSYVTGALLIGVLMMGGCPKPTPGPVQRPQPERRAATPRAATPKAPLKALLKELKQSKAGTEIALRMVLLRYLPAAQAATMPEKGSATILRVSDDNDTLMGAFLELRPAPSKRCVLKADDAAKVYWLAEQVGTDRQRTLRSTPVKTQMLWGQKKPKPEVELPMAPLRVPVFKVKTSRERANLCHYMRPQYFSLETTEVYTAVRGRLHRILKFHSHEIPIVAGAILEESVKTRWVETESKVLYLALIRVAKRKVPMNAAPPPGRPNPSLHHCSRKVTVYEITATGTAKKLSSATLKARRKTTPAMVVLPEDLTSKVEDACDYDPDD